MSYIFEWDGKKAQLNLLKHGVGFEEASTVFGDPFALLMPDPDHSVEEMRYILLGMSNQQRLVVVSFTERTPRTRLISARYATKQERGKYEKDQ